MSYFTKDFIKFFTELSENNNREWFKENKERYEKSVKEPFYNLVSEIITRISFDDPTIMHEAKDVIFRIYRDTRFSKDKTPYKLHASAAISSIGKAAMNDPGFYFELNHTVINFYCGMYMVDKDGVARIRNHIAHNMKQFDSILKTKKFKELFGGKILGEKSKRLPKEFTEAALKQPLIYNTQFYVHGQLDNSKILDKKLPDIIMKHYQASRELIDFFKVAMKRSNS
ncbi:MAG: DUF2461 domain-containing protein [bacterium]